jgi:hypothetical protein
MRGYDFTTEVSWMQGYLWVMAQVTINADGDFYLDWWEVEGKLMYRDEIPDELQEVLFEIADDHKREDSQ